MTEFDTDTRQDQSGPEWCRQVGDAALDGFLVFVAGQGSQPLTPSELRALAQRFKADPEIMADRYQTLWNAGGQAKHGADIPDRRAAPLQRLLVERFAHLFAPSGSDLRTLADGSAAVERQAIPGILAAFATMAPGNLWDRARRRTVDIAAELRMRHGPGFNWEHVERHPEVQALMDDVRMAVLPYFEDFEKRKRWFLGVVDRHQADNYGPDADGMPVLKKTLLDDDGLTRVLAGIYDNLAVRLASAKDRAALIERYGSDAVAALSDLLDNLSVRIPATETASLTVN